MKKKKKRENSGLSTTMMVDVLFILLIFFILISKIKQDNLRIQAAKVKNTPKQQKIEKKTVQHSITIDGNNRVYVDGRLSVDFADLQQALLAVKRAVPPEAVPVITLRTDAQSSSGKLLEIFAALNEADLADYVQCEVNSG